MEDQACAKRSQSLRKTLLRPSLLWRLILHSSEKRTVLHCSKDQLGCFLAERNRACRWAGVNFYTRCGVRPPSWRLRLTVHLLTSRTSCSGCCIWTPARWRLRNHVKRTNWSSRSVVARVLPDRGLQTKAPVSWYLWYTLLTVDRLKLRSLATTRWLSSLWRSATAWAAFSKVVCILRIFFNEM